MFRKLYSVPKRAWLLLAGLGLYASIGYIGRTSGIVAPSTSLYIIEPIMCVLLAGAAYAASYGRGDRIKHKADKAFIVGSIMAIWFVLYFSSGIVLTYTYNALATGIGGVVLNSVAYGLTAACLEYVRYSTMLIASRRNVIWFGTIVALVFSLEYMNIAQFYAARTLEDIVEIVVASVIPGIVASFLLTYLAFTSGLASQLVYRLGVVAMIILPPFIPRYDWYLIGVSSMLLSIAVYIAIDRTRQDRAQRSRSRRHHSRRAYDVMLVIVMIGLVMFMTGFFAYRPMAIVSDSMAPVFYRGSVVIAEKINDPMDVQVGDILQYESAGRIITHRVVEFGAAANGNGERVFITKGDNSPSRDAPVTQQQAIGVVRAQIPYIGYPTVWLREIGK